MKHPNKKVEKKLKRRCQFNKWLDKTPSCFNHWLNKPRHAGFINLTENSLLNALVDARRKGKTIRVELKDL